MIENLLVDYPWPALVACVALYTLDHYLSLYEAYLYHSGASEQLVFKGRYEQVAGVVKDVEQRRFVSLQLVLSLAAMAAGLAAAWWVFTRQYALREAFVFLLGGLILFELYACIQHARYIVLFRYARAGRGDVQGTIAYSRRLVLMQGVIEQYSFVVLYALVGAMFASWFFLGGAATCLIAARRRRDLASVVEAFPQSAQRPPTR